MSAFWRRKVDLPAMLGPVSSHRRWPGSRSQSLATKLCAAWRFKRRFDHRMAAGLDRERRARFQPAAGSSRSLHREFGDGRRDVERGQRRGRRAGSPRARARASLTRSSKSRSSSASALSAARRDPAFELAQFGWWCSAPRSQRLAVDEGRPELARVIGRHLDVIAQHVVVADLERSDARSRPRSAPGVRPPGGGFRRASARSSSSSGA